MGRWFFVAFAALFAAAIAAVPVTELRAQINLPFLSKDKSAAPKKQDVPAKKRAPREEEDDDEAPGAKGRADLKSTPEGQCVVPAELYDRDGDIRRNLQTLAAPGLCARLEVFTEGKLRWVLQVIQNRGRPNGPLWVVPHDNENAAFDSAVHGLLRYGGTLIAVETNGRRLNGRQDPNRNFDAGIGSKCPHQVARSPVYTERVLRWWRTDQPIIALHTNEQGFEGDRQKGRGHISMAKAPKSAMPFRAVQPIESRSPDDTLVFVASTRAPKDDPNLGQFVKALNERGVHVLYEVVTAKNDCSMSNYAALSGIRNYVNVEVVHGDAAAQKRMIDIIVPLLMANGGIGPLN